MPVEEVTLTGQACLGVAPELIPPHLFGTVAAPVQRVKLGRIRPTRFPLHLRLSAFIDLVKAAGQLPPMLDYYTKAATSISRMYLNDTYGDCVIAGKYHATGVWTANDSDSGGVVVGTDQEVLASYRRICGPGDNGCNIEEVLRAFQSEGLPFNGKAHKIDGYIGVDWTSKDLVKASLYLFGAASIGVNLPSAWTNNSVWDVTNSSIVGGHDVTCVGYNDQGVQISSWAKIYTITWAAFLQNRWVEEFWALLSADWYNSDKLAPCGLNVAALQTALQQLGGGTIPPLPDPNPPPPPPPPVPGGPTLGQVLHADEVALGRLTATLPKQYRKTVSAALAALEAAHADLYRSAHAQDEESY